MLEQTEDLDLSELDHVRTTIPDGARLESPILLRVSEIKQTPLSDNAPVVKAYDRNGGLLNINVWDSHTVTVEWTVNHWYAISGARGYIFEAEAGDMKYRLTSTEAFVAHRLGKDIDPKPMPKQPNKSVSEDTNNNNQDASGKIERGDKCQSDGVGSRDVEDVSVDVEEGSVLNDIVNDFDI